MFGTKKAKCGMQATADRAAAALERLAIASVKHSVLKCARSLKALAVARKSRSSAAGMRAVCAATPVVRGSVLQVNWCALLHVHKRCTLDSKWAQNLAHTAGQSLLSQLHNVPQCAPAGQLQ